MLAAASTVEPLVVDLREAGGTTLADPTFRRCIARLCAPIQGQTVEELDDADRLTQRRALRQGQGAVSLLALLLVAAVTAGLFAVSNAREAREQAVRSTARFLAAQSSQLLRSDVELGMLAAVQPSVMEDSVGTRQALLTALQHDPLTVATTRPDPNAWLRTVALSPSGRIVAAATEALLRVWHVGPDRSLMSSRSREFRDIRSLAVIATLPALAEQPDVVAVSADRTQVAVVANRALSTFRLPRGEPTGQPVPLGPRLLLWCRFQRRPAPGAGRPADHRQPARHRQHDRNQ